jgi:glycerol-3-phosphate acyltransferase PlsY
MPTMPAFFLIALTAILAYLIGALPFGYWFVRVTSGQDIRAMGSGNIGATNVYRTRGRQAGAIVLLLDILKGFLAVLLAAWLAPGSATALALAAALVMAGHCYPVFLRFQGGKAVACFVGAFLYIAPVALGVVLLLFIVIVALWRYISLGSILGAAIFPFFFWILYRPAPVLLIAAIFCSALIIYRHQGNIERLRRGKENVFSFKGGKV